MELIKIYDKYINQLAEFDSLGETEQQSLIEEITRVLFSEDDLRLLTLSYYTSFSDFNYKEDAIKLKAKLEFMKAVQLDNERNELRLYEKEEMALEQLQIKREMQNNHFTINNTNHNESTSTANVAITFEEVRKNIENMDKISQEEIHEITNKIKEIQDIVTSNVTKAEKWDNIKEIIKWVADKSVDVGVALLPLILKIS